MSAAEPRAQSRDYSGPVSVLAYRSLASREPGPEDMDQLLRAAQSRNRREGVTGLLIYDQGRFFQWIEGPEMGLNRVWDSIRRDPRHQQVEVLRREVVPQRFFSRWDMSLARRPRGPIDSHLAAATRPTEVLRRLQSRPAMLADGAWDDVFSNNVLPRLARLYAGDPRRGALILPPQLALAPPLTSSARIWHADATAGDELADLLQAVDGAAISAYVDRLIGAGASLEALYREVFEPAARCLGTRGDADDIADIHVTLSLVRLQTEVRRVSSTFPRDPADVSRTARSVLVAPTPGDPHGLGAAMISELFWRDGWDVSCEFPAGARGLAALVRDRWFDVVNLASSAASSRQRSIEQLRSLVGTIQAASCNPALAVIVAGRVFFERPGAWREVGADAACMSVLDIVPTAKRLLDAGLQRQRYARAAERSRELTHPPAPGRH